MREFKINRIENNTFKKCIVVSLHFLNKLILTLFNKKINNLIINKVSTIPNIFDEIKVPVIFNFTINND